MFGKGLRIQTNGVIRTDREYQMVHRSSYIFSFKSIKGILPVKGKRPTSQVCHRFQ